MIPLYKKRHEKNKEKAKEYMSVIFTLLLLLSFIAAAAGFLLAPVITGVIAPGFSEENAVLANQLTRIMIPSVCFMMLSAVATGVLHANKQFLLPALAIIPNSVLVIVFIYCFHEEWGIHGAAAGSLLGFFLQFLIQLPHLRKQGIGLNRNFSLYRQEIKDTVRQLGPILAGTIAVQINSVIERVIASGLEAGSVSALNYASKLMHLPLTIVILSLVTVYYPTIVDLSGDKEKMMNRVHQHMKSITIITIPIMTVMMVEYREMVEVVFKRGHFDSAAAEQTSVAFLCYTAGLLFIGMREYLIRCFFALDRSKSTMYVSFVSIGLNVALGVWLSGIIGHGGIALATSLSFFAQTVLYLILLPKVKTLRASFRKDCLKAAVLGTVVGAAAFFLKQWAGIQHSLISILFTAFIVLLVYGLMFRLFYGKEVKRVILSKGGES